LAVFNLVLEGFDLFEDEGAVWVKKELVGCASFNVRPQERAKETDELPDNGL